MKYRKDSLATLLLLKDSKRKLLKKEIELRKKEKIFLEDVISFLRQQLATYKEDLEYYQEFSDNLVLILKENGIDHEVVKEKTHNAIGFHTNHENVKEENGQKK